MPPKYIYWSGVRCRGVTLKNTDANRSKQGTRSEGSDMRQLEGINQPFTLIGLPF